MDAYSVGRLFGVIFIAVVAGALLWAGVQRTRRGQNGTRLIAAGAMLAITFLVMILRGGA